MSVGALEPQFYRELLKGLGLTYDEVPQTSDLEEAKEIFTKKFLEKTQAEWSTIFDKIDACVMPVLSFEDAVKHPHNKDSFVKKYGEDKMAPKPSPRLSRTPGESMSRMPLPQIGQHTREILTNLNYSKEKIDQLEEEGVVSIHRGNKL